jgi:hypothetical protein
VFEVILHPIRITPRFARHLRYLSTQQQTLPSFLNTFVTYSWYGYPKKDTLVVPHWLKIHANQEQDWRNVKRTAKINWFEGKIHKRA